ncbi:MAG: prevent-host-death protein [Pseudomonadota bacterium]
MKQLSIREVRSQLPNLDQLLSKVGEVIITRRGKPIARTLPTRRDRGMPSHAELRGSMPRLAGGSEKHVRAERDER